jgi:phosphotransferase system  glucose/maltose/N-acetylglucosamine-specific IIC component
MRGYNKIMLYFWLFVGVFLTIAITYLGITDGFHKWVTYYAIALLCFVMFFMRRWMMKRMERHLQLLADQEKEKQAAKE